MVPHADEHTAPQTRPFASMARGAFGVLLMVVTLAVVGAILVPPLLGYHEFAIRGGSMEPTIHRGAVAYAEDVPVSALRERDVITYTPPGHTQPVTHRIVGITRPQKREGPVFRTQGDANAKADLRTFRLDQPTQARYAFSVPYLGWVLIYLENPLFRILALGAPALLVAVRIMGSLWKEGGRILAEQEADEASLEYEELYGDPKPTSDPMVSA